jgi:hypothetical protein
VAFNGLRKITVIVFILVFLGVAFWYLGVYSVRRTFEDTRFDGLVNVLEASAWQAVGNAGTQYALASGTLSPGAISFYQQRPKELNKDRERFVTWVHALKIADLGLRHQRNGEWQSSDTTDWIPEPNRLDARGHSFCFKVEGHRSIVVSAGSNALTSLHCEQLSLSRQFVDALPRGRVYTDSSGALILAISRIDRVQREHSNPSR